MNSVIEQLRASRMRPRLVQDGLMRLVEIHGRATTSNWARILILFVDHHRFRMQSDLSLPTEKQWIWEFRMGSAIEFVEVKGVIVRQNASAGHYQTYEYEARFIMDEQHPLTTRMKESYSVHITETLVQREVKLDLFG